MRPTFKAVLLILLSTLAVLSLSGCAEVKTWSAETFGTKGNLTTGTLAALQIVVAIVMLVSLIALIIPGVPGITFIWLAALIYGLVVGFEKPGGVFMGIITGLMLLGNVVDNLLMGAGARKGGAPWITTLATVLAAVVGSIAFPPFGGVIAAAVVIFVLEIIRLKDSKIALKSTGEMLKGFGCSFLVRFLIGMIMIGLWIAWLVQTGHWLL
jgi:hypothetical protein